MKAEHISIASSLEDIPNIGKRTASLLRECGVVKPQDLAGADAVFLYDKVCQITRRTHHVALLDVLLSAVHFANGNPPTHYREFRKTRIKLLASTRNHSRTMGDQGSGQ